MKKQRRNGFTLVELLAVIIILAVIALIATPIVLNVIENSQRKAFERSAQGYYDAARYVHNEMMLNEEEQDIKFTFEDGIQKSDNPNYKLEVQGETPKSGTVHLSKDGQILVAIANDKWCAATTGNGTVDIFDTPELCGYAPEECLTFSTTGVNDDNLTFDIRDEFNNQNLGFEGMDDESGNVWGVISFDKENPACKGIAIIPNEHEGRKVEKIAGSVFADNTNIISVILPKEMKLIGWKAFQGASNLKQIVMNDELRYIGDNSFENTAITEVTIPSKVAYLGINAFRWTDKLNKVTLLHPMTQSTSYGDSAKKYYSPFRGSSVKEVEFGSNVQKIPAFLFYELSKDGNLEKVTMSEGITSIGKYAFGGNLNLSNIKIPNTVTSIEQGAFRYTSFTSIIIPASVTTIEKAAFYKTPFPNASSITILGDDPNRFDDAWTDIGFPSKEEL